MITDMERIGDQADDIAEIVLYLDVAPEESRALLRKMAEAAIGMVSSSVDAYVRQDVALAEKVIADDDTVDDYFEKVKQALIRRIADDPAEGARVELTYKEFQLLQLFLSHMGTAFTRDQLMEQVWGTDYCGESRTVDMHIRTLRQKLGAYGDHIETVRSVGYRWRAQP